MRKKVDESEEIPIEDNDNEIDENESVSSETISLTDSDDEKKSLTDESETEVETELNEETDNKNNKQTDNDNEECIYKFTKKKHHVEELLQDEIDYVMDKTRKTEPIQKNRITKKFLSKYERVRILGERTKQLSMGAKPMLKNVEKMSPSDIAKAELAQGVLPFFIDRHLPNGQIERWHVNELKIMN